jgi:hypothetical protein
MSAIETFIIFRLTVITAACLAQSTNLNYQMEPLNRNGKAVTQDYDRATFLVVAFCSTQMTNYSFSLL